MKLMTKTLEDRFEQIGDQMDSNNPIIIAKFFDPCGSMTWYATAYYKEKDVCFGYVTGTDFPEWGTFSIEELESLKTPLGLGLELGIERDIYFKETRFKELIKEQEHDR